MEATSAERPPDRSTVIEIIVGPTGKRLERTNSPRSSTVSPASSSSISPKGSSSALGSRAKVERSRLPANAASARVSSSVVTSTSASRPRWVDRYERGAKPKCARTPLAPSAVNRLDRRAATDQHAVGDEAEGSDVDQAPPLVDEIGEHPVDIGIFARPVVAMLLTVENELGTAIFESDPGAFAGLDSNRPFLTLASPPIEARVKRPIGLRARKNDVGGNRRLGVLGNLELRRLHEQAAREDFGGDRKGVDAGVEHAEAARLPDPLLARMPFVDILVPVDLQRLDALAGERLGRRINGCMMLGVPGGEERDLLALR